MLFSSFLQHKENKTLLLLYSSALVGQWNISAGKELEGLLL